MLKVEGLSVGYGEREVLKELNIEFKKGFIYSILGPNGSGKSTFLRVIDKILKPNNGTIYLNGKSIKSFSASQISKIIAYLPQRIDILPFCKVLDAVFLGRKPHISFEPTSFDLEIVLETINKFGLSKFAFRNINELSGGEFQKVLIARAFAQKPEVLLLDEPVNHLDPKNQIEILKLIRKLTKDNNILTIIVLHDINLAIQFSDYFVLMKNGRIFKFGDLTVIDSDTIKEVYEIDVEILEYNGRKLVLF